jgi:hypothetical protein
MLKHLMIVFECVAVSRLNFIVNFNQERSIKPNGTAIEGVCVTGEAIRPTVPVVSKERVPVASRYGAIFAITVRVGFITIAVQVDG